jgi:phospholipid transport system substrate-binding protein
VGHITAKSDGLPYLSSDEPRGLYSRLRNVMRAWPNSTARLKQRRAVMSITTRIESAAIVAPSLRRRSLLAMLAFAAIPLGVRARAATAPATATATVQQLNAALLAAMKTGRQTEFSQRFAALAPAIDEAFDLRAVLAMSVGQSWAGLPQDQQARLLDAFRRYTVASYVANFSNYAGQSFTVSPDTSAVGPDRLVVHSEIVPADGEAIRLDYAMQQTETGWKIVDVLAAGSISHVAVQRSDFRHILSSGGGEALLASLQHKTADLSGGALA